MNKIEKLTGDRELFAFQKIIKFPFSIEKRAHEWYNGITYIFTEVYYDLRTKNKKSFGAHT